ncbi:hypothetical protein FIBSPDRAFT_557490 [Athelia psychrophila]|uniref:Uncharacterized protein n=1 Tax=Athelia psychrophila TaxID=1759441 RepID=A0A166IE60_9AGAM|nr:hypothetical protein FIBSPDRAFT_557490 [Fibularhizoctonia sp. CBS 109695]
MDPNDNPFLVPHHPENMASQRPKPFSFNNKRPQPSRNAADIKTTTANMPIRSRIPVDPKLTQSFHLSENVSLQPQAQPSTQFFRNLPRSQQQARPLSAHGTRLNLPSVSGIQIKVSNGGANAFAAPFNTHISAIGASMSLSSPAGVPKREEDHSLRSSHHSQASQESPLAYLERQSSMTPSRLDHTAEVSLSCQPVTPARDHEHDHSRSQSQNDSQVDEDGEQEAFNSFCATFHNKRGALKTTQLNLAAVKRDNEVLESQIQGLQNEKVELMQRLADVKEVAKKATELHLKNLQEQQASLQELKKDQQKTYSFVDKAQQSFDDLEEVRKDTASTLERLAHHLNETGTLTLAGETRRVMAEFQHEYEQSQEVVKMLREKLVVMGGELIDSRARGRELEADCIKDKQGLKESVKQLLASSQQMAETSLHLRTQQQESLDALVCAAEAEGKLNTAQKQIADMLVLLDERSKKLEILEEVEHDNTNLQSYLHEKEVEVNSLNSKVNLLNSKVNSLNSKVSSLNQTLLDAHEHNQEQKCTLLVQEQKIEDKEYETLNFGSRIEELTATLERLRVDEKRVITSAEQLRFERDSAAQRLSILEQDIAKCKDTIDDYHSKMSQADTRYQLLQERFDEQSLTLRITKEANGDLNVSLNDLDEQLKAVQSATLAQSNTHQVDMAVIQERNTALKLVADKCQADLVMTQQTNTALNGRLVDMAVTQEKNASLKVAADKCQVDLVVTRQMNAALNGQLDTLKAELNKHQVDLTVAQESNAVLSGQLESLKVESQRHRDSENDAKADLRRSLKDLRRIEDDLRAQLSLQDPGIPLEVHEKATDRIKEQGRMIADLTRQATTLAARYKEGKLTEPEATFVQSLIKKTQALHEQELVSKANDIRRIMNINQNLESKIETMHGEIAKLLDIQNRASDLNTKSIMDVASFTANSSLLSDAPSQNEDVNEEPAVITKTPQHHLGKAISTRMKPGPTVRLDKNAGESSHRQTFAALEADSSDEIVEEDDCLEPPPKLGKRDRTAVKEAPRTRQRSTKKPESQASKPAVDPTLKAKARKRG